MIDAENQSRVEIMKEVAMEAGTAIMRLYQQANFEVEFKADLSPVTAADKAAHTIIERKLAVTGIPVLSEEGVSVPYQSRKSWKVFWLIDPLDGTKEFINQTNEFTVNIALIQNNRPKIGVVYAPALGVLYWNDYKGGAWKQEVDKPMQQIFTNDRKVIQNIVASKAHSTPATEEFIRRYPEAITKTVGSSLKFMLVAEGLADCYPRFGPTMEWDTAAAHAIVEAAGGAVVDYENGKPLTYNKEKLFNPWFVAYG